METKSMQADASSIIRDALHRELALFEARERLALLEISEMERKHAMPSDRFLKEFEEGALGDDQDFFVWWGLIRGLKAIRTRKDMIGRMLLP